MCTTWSADPELTISPSQDQEHQSRFFSGLCCTPTYSLSRRSPAEKGRMSHSRSTRSMPLESNFVPSGLTLIPVTVSLCPCMAKDTMPCRRSHALTSLSIPPENTRFSSKENATHVTAKPASNDPVGRRDLGSQIRALPSSPPLTKCISPFATSTQLHTLAWSSNFLSRFPVSLSHRPTVLSALAVATRVPAEFQATFNTAFLWPRRTPTFSHVETLHRKTSLSWDPEAMNRPLGSKLTE
mmetsp:Transcript_15997/g.46937  ORF Transcript_15997/g.46937 Transcript_15997/m.46937 type:complete len:240 (+) Transcript_15997:357-1076(+)